MGFQTPLAAKAILPLLILLAFLISSWMKIENKNKKSRANIQRSVKMRFPYKTYAKIYEGIQRSTLLRRDIQSVYDRLSTLGIYTPTEQVVETVNFYLKSVGIFVVISFISILMYNSLHMIVITIIFAKVVKDLLIFKQLDAIKMRLLQDFSTTLSSISLQYTITNNVEDALSNANSGPLVQKMIQRIIDVLQAGEDKEEELEMFYKQIPFQPIQTLAQVCYITDLKGDMPGPNGEKSFIIGVNEVANETMMEIEKADKIKKAFGFLEFLPLFIIPGIKFAEKAFGMANPAMMLMYNGPYGFWVKLILLLSAIMGYSVIIQLRNTDSSKESDRSIFIDSLLEKQWFYNICKNFVTTNAYKLSELHGLLRTALSKQDLVHLKAKQIVSFITVVVILFTLSIYSVVSAKTFIYNNIEAQTMIKQKPYTPEEEKIIHMMDAKYLSFKKLPTKNRTQKFVLKYLPDLKGVEVEGQVFRLMGKYEQYHAVKYKWKYVAAIYIAGWIVTFIPILRLKMRSKTIQKEAKAEVLQMQTTLGLILNTNMDTQDALFWLEKQANIYKSAIMECFQNFTSNAEESLEVLRDSSDVVEFKKLVDSLSATVQSSTLNEAFSNIRNERAHTLATRKEELWHIINARRSRARYFALGPAFGLVALYIVVPMLYMGATEMMRAFKAIQ